MIKHPIRGLATGNREIIEGEREKKKRKKKERERFEPLGVDPFFKAHTEPPPSFAPS